MAYIFWIASFPRSGNTWLRVVLQNYMSNRDEPVSVNEMDLVHGDSLYRWYEPHTQLSADKLTLPDVAALRGRAQESIAAADAATIVVKTHFPHAKLFGHDLFNFSLAAGVIYLVRNPLDVCVSWANFLGRSFDRASELMATAEAYGPQSGDFRVPEFFSSWSLNVQSWTDIHSDSIVVLRYEDLIADPYEHFGRAVALLMGAPPERQRLERAIQFSGFEILRKQEDIDGFKEISGQGQKFFRSGRIGDGKRELTATQIERIVRDHGVMMEKFDYLP